MLTPRQQLLALLTLCLALLAPFPAQAAGQARDWAPAQAADQEALREPVVFVHGYNADPGVWGALREDLRAAGYADSELFSWDYDTHQSVNEVLAGQLGDYVEQVRRQTGATVGCQKHNDLLGDDATSAGVRAFLATP
ncbi:hypothetical protein J7I97_17675 [Streptomyces sp. ISL-87]|uniref:esterase/lipase family protein n=1 Tax=Streptomyces sp. ISL-87 TaxID=2819188 RepID=UPI001BE9D143|nr:hypothetical protein [Streptomyces sp. ISL-87]MBT2610048.1 hypothetical protein [Streptomyces sp. ISL-87]